MSMELARTDTPIEAQAQDKLITILRKYEAPIKALIGKRLDPARFSQLAVSAIKSTPALAGCSPASFMNSVLLAMQMGVEIRKDSAYLIPFGKQCQLLLDYKAKISLARRSGKVGGIQAVMVRQNDEFDYYYDERGFHLHHRIAPKGSVYSLEQRGPLIGVYAFAELTDGGIQWREPMSIDELERVRKRSRAGASFVTLEEIREASRMTPDGRQQEWQTWDYKDKRRTPWVTDYDSMCLKTVLHSLYKGIPLDEAAQQSQDVDEGFETGKQPNIVAEFSGFDPVDDLPMVEEGSKEAVEQALDEGLKRSRKGPADISPMPATLSAIKSFEKILSSRVYNEILKDNGFENVKAIPTEEKARRVRQLMQDMEATMAERIQQADEILSGGSKKFRNELEAWMGRLMPKKFLELLGSCGFTSIDDAVSNATEDQAQAILRELNQRYPQESQ